ncbi:PerC family transcriptional activator [Trabulsiella guamensis ATCC 49490]|uniref:PerC family transcriptional activator n=1 Tax=Trabulsiella guamensis ATCC 49490 TaxID=1005994 RepID=A0A085AAC1_9ENTR|nr:PerC family transcriptional regulator [Trabulsiella guamensis]KFC07166.1 PerC family transcriptional activator [Trabulsiella guamensis ATCC 49490]
MDWRGDEMVNDTIAEKLEARGFWRRAAARWLDVMQHCATDAQREWISQRRKYCLSMIASPRHDNKLDIGAINRAATATQEAMGINQDNSITFRSYHPRSSK